MKTSENIDRTIVEITDNEWLSIEKVIKELARDPTLFQRDNRLVWYAFDQILPVPLAIIRMKITQHCILIEDGKRISPPGWLTKGIRAWRNYPKSIKVID